MASAKGNIRLLVRFHCSLFHPHTENKPQMVRIGNHSLELVDAVSRQPLQEHLDTAGQTWVAGERAAEYFIRITSHEPGSRTVALPTVDGTGLGYSIQQGPDAGTMACDVGVFASDRHKALCFVRTELSAAGGCPVGHVSVTWRRGYDTGCPVDGPCGARWHANAHAAASDSEKAGVGALRSDVGSASLLGGRAPKTVWGQLEELRTIRINYCEEVGLVVRNIILPRAAAGPDAPWGGGASGCAVRRAVGSVARSVGALVGGAAGSVPRMVGDALGVGAGRPRGTVEAAAEVATPASATVKSERKRPCPADGGAMKRARKTCKEEVVAEVIDLSLDD